MSKLIIFLVLACSQVAKFQETDQLNETAPLIAPVEESKTENNGDLLTENQIPSEVPAETKEPIEEPNSFVTSSGKDEPGTSTEQGSGSEQSNSEDSASEQNSQDGNNSSLSVEGKDEPQSNDSEDKSNSESESKESEESSEFYLHKEAKKLLHLMQSLLSNKWGKKEDELLKETMQNWFGNEIWNEDYDDDDDDSDNSSDDWNESMDSEEDKNLIYTGLSSLSWLFPFGHKDEKKPETFSPRFSSV